MQHVLCLYVLFWNWHQWTDTPNNWHSVSIWPWQYFRLCSTLVPYPLGYLCRVHPIPVGQREIETHINKGFSLRLVWCTNYIPFCHFRILFLWYLSPGSLSVPKVHMVGLILMTLKMYYTNRLHGTIFLNVLSECGSLRIPILYPRKP